MTVAGIFGRATQLSRAKDALFERYRTPHGQTGLIFVVHASAAFLTKQVGIDIRFSPHADLIGKSHAYSSLTQLRRQAHQQSAIPDKLEENACVTNEDVGYE